MDNSIEIRQATDNSIHFTTDYDIFNIKEDNRDIDEKHKRKILASLNDVGYIPVPIVVNEKFEIIDGQHRWSVMKGLGIPIAYIVVPDIGIRECRSMNISGVTWKDEDWIKSYAASGYESYEFLRKLLYEEYPGQFKLTNVLMTTVGKPSASQSIRDGAITVSEDSMDEAYRLLGYVSNINRGMYGENVSAKVANAIIFAIQVDNVDTDRLSRAVESTYSSSLQFGDIKNCLNWLSQIYNYNMSRKASSRIYFENEYDEAILNRESWYAVKWGWVEYDKRPKEEADYVKYQERIDLDD